MEFASLSKEQHDALMEIGKMSAERAVNELSKIVERTIKIDLNDERIVLPEDIIHIVGDPKTKTTALKLAVSGDASGDMLLVFPKENALVFLNMLHGTPQTKVRIMSKEDSFLLREIMNIISGSYLKSLSGFLDINLFPSLSMLCRNQKISEIVGGVQKDASLHNSYFGAFSIKTRFESENEASDAYLVALFDSRALKSMLSAISKRIS